jgi:hypothetical protein
MNTSRDNNTADSKNNRGPLSQGPGMATGYGRVLIVAWLSLVSVCVLVNHLALSRLTKSASTNDLRSAVAALQDRVDDFAQQVAVTRRQPAPVSEKTFTSTQAEFNGRLTRIEHDLTAATPKEDVEILRNRVSALELRAADGAKRPARPAKSASSDASTPAPEPPFMLLGIETRGGERFLAVAPEGVHALSQVRLLRPGDTQDNWRLEALSADVAEFRIDGHTQRVALP